jgi:hypothetical protein
MGVYQRDDLWRFRAKISPAVRRVYDSPVRMPLTVVGERLGRWRIHL